MQNRIFLVALGVLGFAAASRAQSVTLTIDAGQLRNATGTTAVSTGLLQLVASPSGTFSTPTTSSFVGGDNVLVSSFAMNTTGGTGEVIKTLAQLALSTSNYTLTTGESLLLRFYPSLTYSAAQNYYTTAPALGTNFGQVRSSTTEFAASDASETTWIVPAAGAAKDITYVTTANGGTYADGPSVTNVGVNSFSTFLVPAPEPSTYALFIGGFAGLAGLNAWKRRKALRPLV